MAMANVAQNIFDIKVRLEMAAKEGGHKVPPKLIAVSKGYNQTAVEEALAAGHRIFGENRVQEAVEKFSGIQEVYPDLELHLIGPLQTNKVKRAISFFDVIQTLDREKLAAALAKQNIRPRLFIQVNTGEEVQKSGIFPKDLPDFINTCQDKYNLQIEGLMCIPPIDEEPAMHFALLQKLARRHALAGLSMGMSGDFETAAALGATYVRVGSAVFGPRS